MARLSTFAAPLVAVCALAVPGTAGAATPATPATCPPAAPSAAPASAATTRAPANALVACVATTPIVGATFDHWALIAERSSGRHAPRHRLVSEVLGFLITSYWTIGEAAAQGVVLTEAQVRTRYEKIRRQQFPHHGELARFLHKSGETVGDLLFRVRLNMLSQAVQAKILAAAHSRHEKELALVEFIKGFKARWQPQTYCAQRFAVADCGHVQAL